MASLSAGVFWTTAARWIERALGVVSIAILARLLSPEQFGLVASANVVSAAVAVFFTFGFDWALVRAPNTSMELYRTAWTLRFISGVVCAAIITAGAHLTASFFGDPRIVGVLYLLAATVVVGSIENPSMAEFRRNLNFMPEFVCRLISKLLGACVAIAIAWQYRSYWALPLGIFTATVATVVVSYVYRPFWPGFRLRERAELLSFSVWLLLNGIISFLSVRLSDLLVARRLGQYALGLYGAASELSQMAVSELSAPINRAVFSDYSRKAGDIAELKAGYLRASGTIWLIAIPVAAGLGILAPFAVRILFGEKWLDAVPIVQVLCAASVITLMVENTHYVLMAVGKPKWVTAIEAIRTAAVVAALFVLIPEFGLIGAAYTQLLCAALITPVYLLVTTRLLGITMGQFLRNTWRTVMGVFVMVAVLSPLVPRQVVDTNVARSLLAVASFAVLGAGVYVATIAIAWLASGRPESAEKLVFDLLRRFNIPCLARPAGASSNSDGAK